ncbi:MAG: MnhB domain-containing protein [Actinomycetota bacterium]|nr:MnhB domain-containing protein [Actinomycetota bacterium]
MSRHGSLILHVGNAAVFPLALVFSVFLLFAGHNAPGGGFVGGLVAGAAVTLRYADGGADAVRRTVRVPPEVLLGVGLAIAGTVGAAGLLGGELFESGKLEVDVAVLGTVKATSALPFDIGVFLTVVGVVVAALETLGASADRDAHTDPHAPDPFNDTPGADPESSDPEVTDPQMTTADATDETSGRAEDDEHGTTPVHAGHHPNGPAPHGPTPNGEHRS